MRISDSLFTAFALCGVASSGMILPTEQVSALTHLAGMSSRHPEEAFSLIIKIKKNQKCSLAFVCDYFNPATSCSKPPCCKKGHIEKECVPVSGAPGTTPAPPPEPAAGQCNLCTNKGECTPAGSSAECQVRKSTAEQMTVTPFLKWSCICK